MPRKPKQPKPGVILPPELDDDDEEMAGGGIPDDDGMVYLQRSSTAKGSRRGKDTGKKKPAE